MKLILIIWLSLVSAGIARLGDSTDVAEMRYGLPKMETPVHMATLLEGAREVVYLFDGWRIRCALLRATDGKEYVVREEYTKDPAKRAPGGDIDIAEYECEAILEAEEGNGDWVQKTVGGPNTDAQQALVNTYARMSGFNGTVWIRPDGAIARSRLWTRMIIFDLPQAIKYEAEMKELKEQRAKAGLPRF